MLVYFIIILAAVIRVLSHSSGFEVLPPNFAPIGGLALFAGAYLSGKKSWIVPVAALLISDIIIGFYEPLVMVSVYGCFLLTVAMGRYLKHHKNILTVGGAALLASVIFFLVTNFAVWASPVAAYSHNVTGLLDSYIAGIPFFRYTIAGDLFFTAAFFISYEVATILTKRRQVALQ